MRSNAGKTSPSHSIGCALARIPAVGGGQPQVHLAQKPFVAIDKSFNCLARKGLLIPAAFSGKAGKLGFEIRGKMNFHRFSVKRGKSCVNC